ncbi:hypothetical protein GCM10007160_40210 [Litchfieldella qijiaojingensis]|uniref:Uncharacterized protein n=1 Tax=Litchfieldella qijiaojingensis TaxID=980347 RepID=A0ABQ2ZCE5_9GAMM|nr:hypothetical protein GCM10007160_40210 [Halomonas qijiaojingensis]
MSKRVPINARRGEILGTNSFHGVEIARLGNPEPDGRANTRPVPSSVFVTLELDVQGIVGLTHVESEAIAGLLVPSNDLAPGP